jgi:uncharacterized protein (DUF58 family)
MPTRDAAAYAVLTLLLLFVAVNLQAGWVYAVDAVLIGFALAGWLSTYLATRPLRMTRTLPGEVFEGERISVALSIAPVRLPRFFVQVCDAVPGFDAGAVFVPFLWRQGASAQYETVARRRGVHRAQTIELRSEGVTGLFRLRRTVTAEATVTLFPRYDVLRDFPLPGRQGVELTPVSRPARTGVDVAGVRDFRDGDDPAHIHWRSTARRGHLVVREFEREVEPEATIVIDTRPTSSDDEGFENLIRAAASVAHHVTRRAQAVRLLVELDTGAEIATAGWTDTLRILASLQRSGRLNPADLCASLSSGTPVVFFTEDVDAVLRLAAAGTPAVAVITDGAPPRGPILLNAMGVPVRVLRRGEGVGRCLAG